MNQRRRPYRQADPTQQTTIPATGWTTPPAPGPNRRHDRSAGPWVGLVLGATLVPAALVTGLIFTFSAAVMPTLTQVDDASFVENLQQYNANPVFPVSFMITLALLVVAVCSAAVGSSWSVTGWMVAALVSYLIMVGITGVVHVPLNDLVDHTDLGSVADLSRTRQAVEEPWTVWNHVRTLLGVATLVFIGRALVGLGRPGRHP